MPEWQPRNQRDSKLDSSVVEMTPTPTVARDWQRIRQLAEATVWTNLVLRDPPAITGDLETDHSWRQLAESRGYRHRPLVADTSQLQTVGSSNHRLQPQAAEAIHALQAAAEAAGHRQLWVTSAYRDYQYQIEVFLEKVADPFDQRMVAERLRRSAIPGYSWHHTGYAIDLRHGDYVLDQFVNSAGYRWLVEDNYQQARAYGWIPNYPPDIRNQGPDAEPWEFIWVGDVDQLWEKIKANQGKTDY